MTGSAYLWCDPRKHFTLLVFIIVMAAALRLFCFRGFAGLDDAEYARLAYQAAHGTFQLGKYEGPAVFPLRVGVFLPTAMVYRLFGVSEWNMVLYPFSLSVLGLLLAYVCTTQFFGPRAGILASALLAIFPMDIDNATELYPDLPAAFYAGLGVTIIMLLNSSRTQNKSVMFWGGLGSGLAFGISWLCKASIAYLFPFCLVLMVMTLKDFRLQGGYMWLGITIGAIGVLIGEMSIYRVLAGDWLFRFHEIERNYRQWDNGFFKEGSHFGWPKGGSYLVALFKRLFVAGPTFLLLDSYFLFLPLVGLVAAVHAFYWKDRSFLIPSLWLITLLLMFNFASSSLRSYTPLPLFHRYMYMIVLPSITLTSGFIIKLFFTNADKGAQRERRFWGVIVTTAVLLIGGTQVVSFLKTPVTWASEVRVISDIVKPTTPLYTDTLSLQGFEFFRNYPEKTAWVDFKNLTSQSEIPSGSFVLVNKNYIDWLNRNAGMWVNQQSEYVKFAFYDSPPSSWKRMWQNGNAMLYQVGEKQ